MHEHTDEKICLYTRVRNKSRNTLAWLMAKSRQFLLWKNQKTVLHEHLAYENKKILTLMPLKSQVRLRLARVRFLTGHFAWIFNYFLQTIFLAKAVIWFCFTDKKREFVDTRGYGIKNLFTGEKEEKIEKIVEILRVYCIT